jgi:pyruvate/2-oxoglutarate dehydrogenase complex dihydrolipoamide acyltransferase (E2) component
MPDEPMPESMPYLLPDLGEGMTEAELVQWRVAVGDHVTRDQIVAHVQTDKAEVELPVPASGTIVALGAEVGDLVPVGAPLLELVPDEGTALGGTQVRAQPALALRDRVTRGPVTPVQGGGRALAAPPVRKLAKELGIDLATVSGTGPGGRISAADVRAVGTSGTPGSGERREPLRGVRRAMARNMADAWRTVPHISLFDEIDGRPLLDAHAAVRAGHGDGVTLTAFFVRAALLALDDFPILNASLDAERDTIVYHDDRHIGVAVASADGLVVPVVHDAQQHTLVELGHEIARVTEAGRAGHLAPEAIRGATFTVTNFGTEGGRFATPIVRPPQVAILGFGAVRVRPVAVGATVVAAPTVPISLSADHRVIDGRDATGFLEAVGESLSHPDALGITGPRR